MHGDVEGLRATCLELANVTAIAQLLDEKVTRNFEGFVWEYDPSANDHVQ